MPKSDSATERLGRIRIGVGGWSYAPWRGTFYPKGLAQKDELAFAANRLTSIEINATYYRSQTPETFAKWRDETPDDFIFAVKGPRVATNRRVLGEAGAAIGRFFDSGVTELKDKLGPINWQFMATKKFDPEDFERFLELLPKTIAGRPLRHAVEVRHASFQVKAFIELTREHDVAIVVAGDAPYPQVADPAGSLVYLRIMGSQAGEKHGYAAAALEAWTGRARRLAAGETPDDLTRFAPPATKRPRDVFLFVIGGCKERNPVAAMTLIERLG